MFKQRLSLAALVIAVIFLFGLLLGHVLRWPGPVPAKTYNTAVLLQQVQTLSRLVTVKYVMEKVVVLEVAPESVLGQMFAGESRVLMLAHGVVLGGVDLSRMQPADLHVMGKKITLKLPPPQIMEAFLDDKQTRIIERTTGRFRSFDKDLEQTARQEAIDDIRRAARTSGILKDADERARTQLTNLFQQLGFEVEILGR